MFYLETRPGQALARKLFYLGAVKFGEFRLKLHERHPDAPLSPFYFELRTPDNPKSGPLDDDALRMIADGFRWLVRERSLTFDAVSGIPNAGTPIADAFVQDHDYPTVRLIKTGNDATGRCISGVQGSQVRFPVRRVLLLDDVITGADTKREAIDVLRGVPLHVQDLLVVIDREQGGVKELAAMSVATHALFSVGMLTLFYRDHDLIDQPTCDRVFDYLAQEETARTSHT